MAMRLTQLWTMPLTVATALGLTDLRGMMPGSVGRTAPREMAALEGHARQKSLEGLLDWDEMVGERARLLVRAPGLLVRGPGRVGLLVRPLNLAGLLDLRVLVVPELVQ